MTLRPGHEDCHLCSTCGLSSCPDCDTEGHSCPIVHDSDLNGPCDHCVGPLRGYGSRTTYENGTETTVRLCHPDDGPSCYVLVTVHGHPTPCPDCPGLSLTDGATPLPEGLVRALQRHQFAKNTAATVIGDDRGQA